MKERTKQGEKIGGGHVVARRGKRTGRLSFRTTPPPFEHPSEEDALVEARRLAKKHPGETFVVLRQIPGAEAKA